MDAKLIGIAITGAISLITAVLGFYFGQRKVQLEYNKDISIEIWKERNVQYKKLIQIMGVLPKWPHRRGEVQYQEMLQTATTFKEWYFEGGGLFLSHESRKKYFDVQTILTEEILNNQFTNNEKLESYLNDNQYEKIRGMMSSLRTELTNDLLSRERDRFNIELKKE